MLHYLLYSPKQSEILNDVMDKLCETNAFIPIVTLSQMASVESCGVMLMAELDWMGQDGNISKVLLDYNWDGNKAIKKVGLIVYSQQYWFTKRYAQQLIFVLNQKNVYFPGQCLFEVLPEFENLKMWQKQLKLPMEQVWQQRLMVFLEGWIVHGKLIYESVKPKLLVLHASHYHISNTLSLWELVEAHLNGWEVQKLGLQNGTITDCKGCAFTTCSHYAQNRSCYYGGQMTMEVLPSIENADVIVWVSPNYNDSISAMHAALINRMTVLYRRISFKSKAMYGIIVSGNSGCDSVACQLIGALNINKGFYLPENAFLTAIANSPGSLDRVNGIQEKARQFANQIQTNHSKEQIIRVGSNE